MVWHRPEEFMGELFAGGPVRCLWLLSLPQMGGLLCIVSSASSSCSLMQRCELQWFVTENLFIIFIILLGCNTVVVFCVCLMILHVLGNQTKRATTNYAKWRLDKLNFVLSSYTDPIGDQNDVQSSNVCICNPLASPSRTEPHAPFCLLRNDAPYVYKLPLLCNASNILFCIR